MTVLKTEREISYEVGSFISEINRLKNKKECPSSHLSTLIKAIQNDPFNLEGAMKILKCTDASIHQQAKDAVAFCIEHGFLQTLYYLEEQFTFLSQADFNFEPLATANGYLHILEYLKSKPYVLSEITMAKIIVEANKKDRLDIVGFYEECESELVKKVMTQYIYMIFAGRMLDEHRDYYLSNYPVEIFSVTELPGSIIQYLPNYFSAKLEQLKQKKNKSQETDPYAIFDLKNTKKALVCYYMLEHIISYPQADSLHSIHFLLSIPSVKALALASVVDPLNDSNALLHLALSKGNMTAFVAILEFLHPQLKPDVKLLYLAFNNNLEALTLLLNIKSFLLAADKKFLFHVFQWNDTLEVVTILLSNPAIHELIAEDAELQVSMGYIYSQNNQTDLAIKYFTWAANQGNQLAMYYLAEIYSKTVIDYKKAIHFYSLAKELGATNLLQLQEKLEVLLFNAINRKKLDLAIEYILLGTKLSENNLDAVVLYNDNYEEVMHFCDIAIENGCEIASKKLIEFNKNLEIVLGQAILANNVDLVRRVLFLNIKPNAKHIDCAIKSNNPILVMLLASYDEGVKEQRSTNKIICRICDEYKKNVVTDKISMFNKNAKLPTPLTLVSIIELAFSGNVQLTSALEKLEYMNVDGSLGDLAPDIFKDAYVEYSKRHLVDEKVAVMNLT